SMELLKPDIRHALFAPSRPILTRVRDEVPVKFGLSSSVKNSLLADGCIIEGTVENSIIFRGVKVGKGAVVRDSILMQNTEIQSNAQLAYIIADRRCSIKAGRVLAGFASYPVVIGKESVV
ncbi:MAG: glucose-1-phosphate adenylyltransferase subunit GlgD, partial [Oscillospiraceae bacterium]